MRAALAGFPSPRPDFGGGKPERVLCARCGPRLPAPSPGRNHAGQERACRDAGVPCRSLGCCYARGRGTNEGGPRCAHARVPRDPESHPTLPEGGAHASGRGAEREERAGLGGGGLPGPTRPPSVPAASGPSRPSPSLPFPRPRPRRARRVRVSLVRRAVWSRLAPPRSPAAFPRSGSSGDPSLLGAGDPVLALRARDLSLGRGLWRNGGRSSPARRRTRRGPSPPEGPSAAAGASVSAVGVCERGKRKALGAFRGTREGKRLSWTSVVRVVDGGSVGRGASGDSSGPVVLRGGACASHVWETAVRTGLGAWR